MTGSARLAASAVIVLAILLGAFRLGLARILTDPAGHTRVPPALSDAGRPVPDETYLWRPVAIGGGGSVTGLSMDPSGQTRLVRTDVYGAYIWDDRTDRWQQLVTAERMPPEDRWQSSMAQGVYEVVVAPGRPQRLYMALRGKVYRSDDRGNHWLASTNAKPFVFSPNSGFRFRGPFMAVDPANADAVLLGTEEQGLMRSDDGGVSWHAVDGVPPAAPDADGRRSGMPVWFGPGGAYVASPGHGLFRSSEGGHTFHALTVGDPAAPKDIARAAFAPDGSLWAVSNTARAIYRLKDGHWLDLVAKGMLAAKPYVGVAVDPRSGRIVVVDDGGDAFLSTDAGGSWQHLGHSARPGEHEPPWLRVNNISYFATGSIAFDPVVKDRLWAMTGTGPYHADCLGHCGTLAWVSAVRGIEELVTSDVAQPPGRAPLFAALDFGIHLKEDLNAFSTGYGPAERVLIAAQQVAWTPADTSFLVTNASDTRTFCCSGDGNAVMAGYSTDGGHNWTKFASLPQPPGTRADDPWRMAFGTIAVAAHSMDNIVWVPGYDRAPYYTLDRGLTWQRVVFAGEKLPDTGSYPIIWIQRKTLAADRVARGTFYFYHGGSAGNAGLKGIWRTQDGGRHWAQLTHGELAPVSQFGAKLRAVDGHAGHLFFTAAQPGPDARLRRSTDGGRSWQTVDAVTQADDIAFGKAAPGADYPAIYVSGQVNRVYGLWRSVDNARSWHRLAGFPLGRLDQVVVMEADKSVFGRVYLGYMGSGWVYGEPARCTVDTGPESDHRCEAVQ